MEAQAAGTQFACVTGTKVQILTLQAPAQVRARAPPLPLYWYKSANTDAEGGAGRTRGPCYVL